MEFGKVVRNQVLNDLKFLVKDFKFYPKSNEKPLNSFKLDCVVMPFTFEKSHFVNRLEREPE